MRYEVAALTLLILSLVLGAVYGKAFDFGGTTDEHATSYIVFALILMLATMISFLAVPVLVVWGIVS